MDINRPHQLGRTYEIVKNDNIKGERLFGTLISAVDKEVIVQTNNKTMILSEGESCYVRPMTWLSVQGERLTELRIDLHTAEIPLTYAFALFSSLGERFDSDEIIPINEDFSDAIAELENENSFFSARAEYILFGILQALAKSASSTAFSGYDGINTIAMYIDTHSSQPLEAGALAAMCGMSYPNFARRFHEIYGRSCKEHISYVRTVRARRLLMNTALDLTAIASETGFFDSSHLIRTYKKILGITPSSERKK